MPPPCAVSAGSATDLKTARSPRASSIRGRLLAYLLLPLILLMVASIWADHRSFVTPVYDTFDRALSRTAVAIAAHVQRTPDGHLDVRDPGPDAELMPPMHRRLGRPPPIATDPEVQHPPSMSMYPGAKDNFLYRVARANEQTLAGDAGLPIVPGSGTETFVYSDMKYRDSILRIVSYRTIVAGEPLIISAAETMHRRDMVVRRLDTVIGISDSIQLLLVMGLCLFGITVALHPLNKLRDQIVRQKPQSLQPMAIEPIPGEVRPLVESLNTMLVTVRDSTRAQQHFLTNAAHQLRTPLTGLKAQLEVLSNETQDAAQQSRIALLQGSVDRLTHTANQLLALARAEPSAHRPSDFVPLQLPELVGTVIDLMLDRAVAREIDLGAECAPAQALGVHWLLNELLVNLLDNAIRHTPNGGQITLRCGVTQGKPFLEVEDSGPGIPLEERTRIRERFYRAPGNDGRGTGLGLAIVDEIARSHGAHLQILDALSDNGARMRVEFPAA
jgi:two-component system, OmpR family, sensor histidine kinase TctE